MDFRADRRMFPQAPAETASKLMSSNVTLKSKIIRLNYKVVYNKNGQKHAQNEQKWRKNEQKWTKKILYINYNNSHTLLHGIIHTLWPGTYVNLLIS